MKFNHFFLLLLLGLNLVPPQLMGARTRLTGVHTTSLANKLNQIPEELKRILLKLDANPQSQFNVATFLLLAAPYFDYQWQRLGSGITGAFKPEECSRIGYENSKKLTAKDSPQQCSVTPLAEWYAPKTNHYVSLPFNLISNLSSILAILKFPVTRSINSTLFSATNNSQTASETPTISSTSIVDSSIESQQNATQRNIILRGLSAVTIAPLYRFFDLIRYTLVLAGIPLDIIYGLLRFTFFMIIFALKNPAFSAALALWIRALINLSKAPRIRSIDHFAVHARLEHHVGIEFQPLTNPVPSDPTSEPHPATAAAATSPVMPERSPQEVIDALLDADTRTAQEQERIRRELAYLEEVQNPDDLNAIKVAYEVKVPEGQESSLFGSLFSTALSFATGVPTEDKRRLHATITSTIPEVRPVVLIAGDKTSPAGILLERLTAEMLPGLTQQAIDEAKDRARALAERALPSAGVETLAERYEDAQPAPSTNYSTTLLNNPEEDTMPTSFNDLARRWREHRERISLRAPVQAARPPNTTPLPDPSVTHPRIMLAWNVLTSPLRLPGFIKARMAEVETENERKRTAAAYELQQRERRRQEDAAQELTAREARGAEMGRALHEQFAREEEKADQLARKERRTASKKRRNEREKAARPAAQEELNQLRLLTAQREPGSSKPFAHVPSADSEDSSDED